MAENKKVMEEEAVDTKETKAEQTCEETKDTDDRQRNTSDTSDVEYKENTNTLYIKKQKTYNMEENIQSATAMSEEEIFKRLHEERH
jgi:hypothetical protein